MPTPQAIAGLSAPGDYTYPQYSRTYTRKVSSTLTAVKKGELYTTNGDGELRLPDEAAGIDIAGSLVDGDMTVTLLNSLQVSSAFPVSVTHMDFSKGIYQCLDDVNAAGGKTVQVMGRGSRILVPAYAGVSVGDLVALRTVGSATALTSPSRSQYKLAVFRIDGGSSITRSLGTVIEIRSGDTKQDTYDVTTNEQLVVVETGGY